MVPLYAVFLSTLGVLKWMLAVLAARMEKRYTLAAQEAEQAGRQTQLKPGNASQHDVYVVAKRQYELGRLVDLRDNFEARHHAWQVRVDRVGAWLARLRGVKGRLVPYLFGVVDLGLVLVALHYLGLPHELDPDQFLAWVESMKP